MPDMRFAPPPAMRVSDKGGGLNQTSVRTYNERLVMSLLRQHDSLSRMELGQISGLSAQTVSVIVRALERDGLLLFGEAQRGRVGPPSTPMSLNPAGAFSIGIKVGPKNTDLVLIDFIGGVRHHLERHYDAPKPDEVLGFLAGGIAEATAFLPQAQRERIVGVGISLPEEIASWPGGWADLDFEARIGEMAGLPAHIQNDVTAAAGAEVIFGVARTLGDFSYFFVGAQTASRMVLNHHIYAGRRGQAAGTGAAGSLTDLETALAAAGLDSAEIWRCVDAWPDYGPVLEDWIGRCAEGLCEAILSVTAFVDVDTAIIDGRFPPAIRERLCAALGERLPDGTGLTVLPARVGALAKAVGAASLPFHSRFMVENVGLASS